MFFRPEITFYSSKLLNRTHDFNLSDEFDDCQSPNYSYQMSMDEPIISNSKKPHITMSANNTTERRSTIEENVSIVPSMILSSFYRKGGIATKTATVLSASNLQLKTPNLYIAFSSIQPATSNFFNVNIYKYFSNRLLT